MMPPRMAAPPLPKAPVVPQPAIVDASAPPPAAPAQPLDLRRQLVWVTVAWAFGSVWLWSISGAAMTQFCRELGMPDYGFGILATLPFLGTLIQLPVSYILERYGHRRTLFLWTATLQRLLWTLAAFIPWLLPGVQQAWWVVLIVVLGVSWLLGQASSPAWMSWMSDLIPRRVRGRYFAVRRVATQPIGLFVTVGIGYAMDLVQSVQDERPDIMLPVTAAILAIAGLFGALDILCFRNVKDPAPPKPHRDVNLFALLGRPLADRHFRRYVAFNFTFMLGVGFMGQYVWLYAFDVVGWTYWQANLLIIGLPLVLQWFTFQMWGRLIDRYGKKPILLITGFVTVWGAVGWMLINADRFWLGYTMILLTTMAWPGMEIANFNFTLDLAGSRKEHDEHPHAHQRETAGTAYVAVNSIVVALGGILSGLLAAAIAGRLEGWESDPLPIVGVALTYHGVLFIISTLLRGASLIWAAQLEEPRATGTRDAIRYMTAAFYSNVRSALLVPSRTVGHVMRWSYRLNR